MQPIVVLCAVSDAPVSGRYFALLASLLTSLVDTGTLRRGEVKLEPLVNRPATRGAPWRTVLRSLYPSARVVVEYEQRRGKACFNVTGRRGVVRIGTDSVTEELLVATIHQSLATKSKE